MMMIGYRSFKEDGQQIRESFDAETCLCVDGLIEQVDVCLG